MEGELVLVRDLIIVFVLIVVSCVLVALEAAMLRSSSERLLEEELSGKFGCKLALNVLEGIDQHLLAVQFGLTITLVVLGWWGISAVGWVFELLLVSVGASPTSHLTLGVSLVFSLMFLASSQAVLAELVSRHLAIRHPERILRVLAAPVIVLSFICRPLTISHVATANLFLRLFGMTVATDMGKVHSSTELVRLISQSTESGELDKDEEEMLHGVFGFSETVVREVMIPRPDLVTVGENDRLEDIVQTIVDSGRSRFPVIGSSVDNIKGVLLAKDIMSYFARILSQSRDSVNAFNVRDVMRDAYFVPSSKPIDDLLNEFKHRKLHMAIVLDEHGGVDGVVTLEDLLEEIVGEIYDESDVPETDIVLEKNGTVLVDGGMLVCDINDRLAMCIPEGDYDTVAGFIFSALGRVPDAGDVIELADDGSVLLPDVANDNCTRGSAHYFGRNEPILRVEVDRIDGNRIETVRLKHLKGLSSNGEKNVSTNAQED